MEPNKQGGTRMKKWTAVSAALVLLLSVVLSGCSGGGKSGDGAASPSGSKGSASPQASPVAANANVSGPGQYPIVKNKVNLKVLVIDRGTVQDLNTNAFTKWYEEKTNVHIDWVTVPLSQAAEKINLMLASGDLPDVLMNAPITPTQMVVYGQQGLFLSLNELIDKYGFYTKQLFQDVPFIKERITTPDGKIYALPSFSDCYHCSMSQKFWIDQKWLDKLGLKTPTTTDDFYQVLKAFKEKDPNGNGKPDEIPFAGATTGANTEIEGFLMNAFTNYDKGNHYLQIVGGKLQPAFTQPGFKDGLKYLHKLYAEGLLAPESFTQDINQLKKLVANPDAALVGAVPAHNQSVFVQIQDNGRWLDYTALAPLQGPGGTRQALYSPYSGLSIPAFIITKASKNPEVALRWGEGFYELETMERAAYGVPGTDWRPATADEKSIAGGAAKWTRLITFGTVQNQNLGQVQIAYQPSEFRLSESSKNPLEVSLYNETKKKYEPYKVSVDQVLPPLWFTEDQSAKIVDMQTTIEKYVKESIARFVTGGADIDKGWDDYLKNLNDMNVKGYLDLYQKAYDQTKKK
ncbi:MAG: extracellular solute-binding protein [Paenibacillaceae bacterium]|nr:extracellular solute-binding protein [Paenibacillaceae bacterium]